MAENTSKDQNSKTTSGSQFFVNHGYNLRFRANTRPAIDHSNARGSGLATAMQDIQNMLKEEMAPVQDIYREIPSQRRLPSP